MRYRSWFTLIGEICSRGENPLDYLGNINHLMGFAAVQIDQAAFLKTPLVLRSHKSLIIVT